MPDKTTELLLDGTSDSLVPGSWLVSEQTFADGTTKTFLCRIVSARQYTWTVQLSSTGPPTRVARTSVTLDGPAYDNVAGLGAAVAVAGRRRRRPGRRRGRAGRRRGLPGGHRGYPGVRLRPAHRVLRRFAGPAGG